MRAVVASGPGGPEVLNVAEVPLPEVPAEHVLVSVAGAGVNYTDLHQRAARPPYQHTGPYVPGSEGAGTVVATGADVEGVRAGERVAWWVPGSGSYAEFAVVPAARTVPVPAGIDLLTAATVLTQGLTAHYLATSTYHCDAGDVVVVHAAAGGTGLLLTQIAAMWGPS